MSMNEQAKCHVCRAPERRLWAPVEYQPELESLLTGNYIALDRCPACGWLWVLVPWEPYASFPYLVRWDRSLEDWQRLHDLDKGATLHKWHEAMIVELYGTLDDDGIDAIRRHRMRAHGEGPLERENIALPDLDSLLSDD